GPLARDRGLLTREQERALAERLADEDRVMVWFRETTLSPARTAEVLERVGSAPLVEPTRAIEVLRRPGVTAAALAGAVEAPMPDAAPDVVATVEVELKYEGYVARERERAERLRRQAAVRLDVGLPYEEFVTLSFEAREKLARVRP